MKTLATNGTRAALALRVARKAASEGHADPDELRELGIDRDSPLTFGEEPLLHIIREAGRAPGFGSQPIDERIRNLLDGAYGWRQWQKDRPPHRWERGGNDEILEKLLDEEDAAVAAQKTAQDAMWDAIRQRSQLQSPTFDGGRGPSRETWQQANKAVEDTTKAWEEASKRESVARGAVGTRQMWLQENWLREEAKRLAKK